MYLGVYGQGNPFSSSVSRVASVYWEAPKEVPSFLVLMPRDGIDVVLAGGVVGGVLVLGVVDGVLDGGVGSMEVAVFVSWPI